MNIETIIITAITGLLSGGFTLAVTLLTMKARARVEARQRVWKSVEWALEQALSGQTPEARLAGRRAARGVADRSEDPEVAAFVSDALGADEPRLIIE